MTKGKGLRRFFALVVGITAVSISGVALVAAFGPAPPAALSGPLRVASVGHPDAPVASYATFPVTAKLEGSLVAPVTVTLQFTSYFARVEAGSFRMEYTGDRTYAASLSGFPDGTEVWVAIAASGPTSEPAISETFTVQVGTIARGGTSGLRIQDVQHVPAQPQPFDSVSVEATVVSSSTITEVAVAYMGFCQDRTIGIDPPMVPVAPHRYTIALEPPGQCGFSPGTTILYRVLAMDASGNTAVSDVGVIRFT